MNRRRAFIAILALTIASASLIVAVYGSLLYETAAAILALTVAGLIALGWRATGRRP